MSLKRKLLGLAIIAGWIVLCDRILRALAGPLPASVSGDSDSVHVDGFEVHIIELGSTDDPGILLVHDIHIGASSREFAELARELADDHHVVCIDLPGFGRSDRPPITYTPELFGRAITTVANERMDHPTVVTHGLSTTFVAATDEPSAFERVVAIAPRTRRSPRSITVSNLLNVPIVGTAVYNTLASRTYLGWHLERIMGLTPDRLPLGMLDYTWQSAHQPGSRRALADWFAGDLDAVSEFETILAGVDAPLSFVIGERAVDPSLTDVRQLASGTDASVSVVEQAVAVPHLEAPSTFADHLTEELLVAG